ncbi:MAG TPA: ABC transporter permease subunit [Chloroflexota bacterium]
MIAVLIKEFESWVSMRSSYVLLTMSVVAFGIGSLGVGSLVLSQAPLTAPSLFSSRPAGGVSPLATVIASSPGSFVFLGALFALLVVVAAVAPVVAGGTVMAEREARTLEVLLVNGSRAMAIVGGKLLAATAATAALVLVLAPGFAAAWLFGGVSAAMLAAVGLLLLGASMLFGATGIFFSTVLRSSLAAVLCSYAVAFALLFVAPFAYLAMAASEASAGAWPLVYLNPFLAAVSLVEAPLRDRFLAEVPSPLHDLLASPHQQALPALGEVPHWAITLALYVVASVLLVVLSSLIIDPCHRLKASWPLRGITRGVS